MDGMSQPASVAFEAAKRRSTQSTFLPEHSWADCTDDDDCCSTTCGEVSSRSSSVWTPRSLEDEESWTPLSCRVRCDTEQLQELLEQESSTPPSWRSRCNTEQLQEMFDQDWPLSQKFVWPPVMSTFSSVASPHCGFTLEKSDSEGSTLQTDEAEAPILPPPVCTDENYRRNSRRNAARQIKAGAYIGVRCEDCTHEACRVVSKKTSEDGVPLTFQKCHCYVKEVRENTVLICYMKGERSDEWMEISDTRIVLDKDEKWCAHGRLCNRAVRRKPCANYDKKECCFCHDPVCLG